MAKEKTDLLTAGKIAVQLGISGGVVAKTIKSLDLKPDLVKAGCNYYGAETIKKIKSAVK